MSFINQIALVADAPVGQPLPVQFDELARVGAALQKQVSRDLAQHWDVEGTISPFARLEDVPTGYWPVIVRDDIGVDTAGIHCDKHGQPMALVTSGPDWSLTASHEVLEMLVDPFGRRIIAGQSPLEGQGRVEFLVEVSDPVSDAANAYPVNGLLVSDFYTPHYFDPVTSAGVQYSINSKLTSPRQVLSGGYLTWHDPVGDDWWQQSWFSGSGPTICPLGRIEDVLCGLRSAVDSITARRRRRPHEVQEGAEPRTRQWRHEEIAAAVIKSAHAKAASWRQRCAQIVERSAKRPE